MIERLLGLISLLCHQHCHPATQTCVPSHTHIHTQTKTYTWLPHFMHNNSLQPFHLGARIVMLFYDWTADLFVSVCVFAVCVSPLLWRYWFFSNREVNDFVRMCAHLFSSQPLNLVYNHCFLLTLTISFFFFHLSAIHAFIYVCRVLV